MHLLFTILIPKTTYGIRNLRKLFTFYPVYTQTSPPKKKKHLKHDSLYNYNIKNNKITLKILKIIQNSYLNLKSIIFFLFDRSSVSFGVL